MVNAFDKKILGYAAVAAAGATGAVQAAIITAPTNSGGGGTFIQLGNGTNVGNMSTDDFAGGSADANPADTSHATSHGYLKAGDANTTSSKFATVPDTHSGGATQGLLANFAPGTTIDASTNFTGTGDIGFFDRVTGGYYTPTSASGPGQFALGVTGYAAIKFIPSGVSTDPFNYGYIALTVNQGPGSAPTYSATLTYDDTGAAITIPGGVPEPTSLAMLALGAVGLLRRR